MSNKITRYGHKSDSQIIDSLRAENAALRKEVEQLKSELASEKQDYLDCEHMLHSERDTWQNKISELTRQRDLAVSALDQIEKWIGEFPASGRFYDEPFNLQPISYGAAFGSNGERDYMRNVAKQALAAIKESEV